MTPETALPTAIQEYYLGHHRRRSAALARIAVALLILGLLAVLGAAVASGLTIRGGDEVQAGMNAFGVIVSLAFLFVCSAVGLALGLHSRRLTPSRVTSVAVYANAVVLMLLMVTVAIALRA